MILQVFIYILLLILYFDTTFIKYFTILYIYDIYRYRSLHLLLYIYISLFGVPQPPFFRAAEKILRPCLAARRKSWQWPRRWKWPTPSGKSRRRVISQPVVPQVGALKKFNICWVDEWVCLKMLCSPKPNGFADQTIPIKWLFHWEYTLFSDKPICWVDEWGL